jgi:Zn-dependent M32 family carboxypeptidase
MSDIYNIKIGNEKNFKLQTKEDIQKNIMNEADELIKEGNYYKALKRIFSDRKIGSNNTIDNKIERIIDFLNSDIGIIGKSKSDLDVLIDLLEKYPKQIYADDIYSNLQIIKQFLSSVTKYNMRPIIEKINRTQKLSTIKEIRDELHKLTNQEALIFMKKNSLI